MAVSTWFRNLRSDLGDAIQKTKPVAGVLVGGVLVNVLGIGERAIDKARQQVFKQIGAHREQVEPETRAGIVGLFGGVPVSTILLLAGMGLGAYLLLRKR